MRKLLICCLVLSAFVIAGYAVAQQAPAPAAPASAPTQTPAPAAKAPAASFAIARMEIAASVENHEPAGIAASFPATQEKVFCFLEFKDVKKAGNVNVVWTLGVNEMGRVPLTVKAMSKYRTWANKTITGMKGDWKVDVVDETGAVLKSATFKVQ
jgi:hypothetical protein